MMYPASCHAPSRVRLDFARSSTDPRHHFEAMRSPWLRTSDALMKMAEPTEYGGPQQGGPQYGWSCAAEKTGRSWSTAMVSALTPWTMLMQSSAIGSKNVSAPLVSMYSVSTHTVCS